MLLAFMSPFDMTTLFIIGGVLILPILARMARPGRAVHTLRMLQCRCGRFKSNYR